MIDVFVCTYNPNKDYLKQTVDAILLQTLDASEWAFTIIDNNSKSAVSEIDFIEELKIKVIVEREQGLTAARRCATNNSNADILVFVDDDNILDTDYLIKVKEIFTDSTIGIVSGNIEPVYEQQPEAWFNDIEGMIAVRRVKGDALLLNQQQVYNELFPIGAGMCVRRTLIHDYYHKHLNAENYIEGRKANDLSSAEDIDLDFYALSAGYQIGLSPALKSLHLIPAGRVQIAYVLKLASSSLHSTYLVNQKWSKVFGHPVFNHFDIGYLQLLIRLVIHKLLSFSTPHLIRYNFFHNVLKHKKLGK